MREQLEVEDLIVKGDVEALLEIIGVNLYGQEEATTQARGEGYDEGYADAERETEHAFHLAGREEALDDVKEILLLHGGSESHAIREKVEKL
jgi:hypothetical protein